MQANTPEYHPFNLPQCFHRKTIVRVYLETKYSHAPTAISLTLSHPSSNRHLFFAPRPTSSLLRPNLLTTLKAPVPSLTLCPIMIHSLTPSTLSVFPLAAASNK